MVGLRRGVVLVSWGKMLVVVGYGLCCVGAKCVKPQLYLGWASV